MDITCTRKNKTYENRKLVFRDSKNKTIHTIEPWMGWICHSKRIEGELHKIIRKHAIENLYWLIGRDCEKEEWDKFIWRKHQGILYGVDPNNKYESVFFNEEEYKAALNSFNNK